ncbi:MAG: TonB-dependent receptor [Chitinophagaceae bacterium]|nr:TonB-dependent receptor [Chitinophagaceae bacterium]
MSKKLFRFSIILIQSLLLFLTSFAQQTIRVTGRIAEEGSNNSVVGASVVVKGNNKIGTVTGDDGNFSIQVPSNATLIISSLGYVKKEIEVNNQGTLNVNLVSQTGQLSDVVVIGYGSRQRKDLVGSVAGIRPRDIERSSSLTPEVAMQGQMAGVQVTQGSGDPTARVNIRIRGTNTFAPNGSADPLYVIDGIPIIEGGQGVTPDPVNDPTRRGGINLYTIINPNDIESLTVLKDAAATAAYGVRGANGVILITTKTGRGNKMRIDLDVTYGIQKIPKTYDVLTTPQYVKFYNDSYNANPDKGPGNTIIPIQNATDFSNLWDPSNPQYIGGRSTYDWQDAIQNKNAVIQDYNLRASGSAGGTSYNFSVGHSNQENVFFGSEVETYSVSTNLITKIGKYLEAGLNLRGFQQRRKNGGGDNLNVWQAAPWQPIYDPNGPYGYAPLWTLNAPITPSTFNKSTLFGRQYVAYSNPLAASRTGGSVNQNQTGIGTAYLSLQPIAGLKIKGSVNLNQITLNTSNFRNFDAWYFEENPNSPFAGVPNAQNGTRPIALSFFNSIVTSKLLALNIEYLKSFKDHNFIATVDISKQDYTWSVNGANGFTTIEDPSLRSFSPSGFERGYSEVRDRYVLLGYFGRISYNYQSKYYLEVLARRDGSSKFAPGYQFGTFPSVAVGWRISQEKFLANVAWLNDLKFKASYGVLGNQTTRGWQFLSVASASPPNYNLGQNNTNNVGISYTNYPNPSLTWEKLKSFNGGFDAVLLNNSLAITVEYYNKVTEGIIQQVLLPPSTGILLEADVNIADVLNRGFEFTASYNKRFGKLGVNASFNLTTQHNEVLSLANSNRALRGQSSIEVGFPIGYINGYKTDGIFQTQKEVDDYNAAIDDRTSASNKPGDIRFQDIYGAALPGTTDRNFTKDGIVNDQDQTYLGKTIPGYFGGVTLGADYSNFDISFLFTYRGDVQRYNFARAAGEGMSGNGRNQFASVLNAWTEQKPNTSIPRAVFRDPNANLRFSDRFVEDAGYVRLQNLQVGYNFAEKMLQRTKVIQNLRLYVTGINLFTITPYSGLDPEADFYFPLTRQLLVGLKASF